LRGESVERKGERRSTAAPYAGWRTAVGATHTGWAGAGSPRILVVAHSTGAVVLAFRMVVVPPKNMIYDHAVSRSWATSSEFQVPGLMRTRDWGLLPVEPGSWNLKLGIERCGLS